MDGAARAREANSSENTRHKAEGRRHIKPPTSSRIGEKWGTRLVMSCKKPSLREGFSGGGTLGEAPVGPKLQEQFVISAAAVDRSSSPGQFRSKRAAPDRSSAG